MRNLRSFIAIPFPEPLRHQLMDLQKRLQREQPELRLVPPNNLHLTLKFLGNRDHECLAKIGAFMLSITGSKTRFSLHFQGIGTFPEDKRARVVWLGIEPSQPLMTLQRELTTTLIKMGDDDSTQGYLPHVTLGRFPRPTTITKTILTTQHLELQPLPVTTLILYRSRLNPQGAEYQPLTVAKFADRTKL